MRISNCFCLILAQSLLLFGCRGGVNVLGTIDLVDSLKGKEVFSHLKLEFPSDMKIVDDKLYISDSKGGSDGKHFSVINLDSPTKVARFVDINDERYCYNSSPLLLEKDINDTIIQLYNIDNHKLYSYNATRFKNRKVNNDDFCYELLLKSENLGSQLSVLGNFYVSDGAFKQGQFALINKQGDIIDYFGKYLDNQLRTRARHPNYSMVRYLRNRSILVSSPNRQYFAAGGRFSDQLTIYTIEGNNVEVVKRYYNEPAIFDWLKVGEENWGDATKQMYIDLYATDTWLYALYSGSPIKGNYQGESTISRLRVFDWKGRLFREYILPNFISTIAIDERTNQLYGTTYDSKLIRYDLL